MAACSRPDDPMAGPHDAPLQALFLPFAQGVLPWSEGPVLFLRARDGFPLREQAVAETLTCEQSFRPFAEALERNGWNVREESEIEADSTRYALVLVLPPRQREEARALFARAVALTAPGGRVVACQSNNEGARSGEADLRQLTGLAGSLTKHHCRTYWTAPLPADTDATLQARWAALDAPRKILDGRFVSRPGVFAWDRIDRHRRCWSSICPPRWLVMAPIWAQASVIYRPKCWRGAPRSLCWICTKPRRAR